MIDGGTDYSRKWYVMVAVGMGTFLSTVDGSIVNIALPTLMHDLSADFAAVQWVVLAYLLTLATLLLGMGRLGDMIGKKSVYAAGFVVFTASSVLCGLAPTIYWLVGFRVLQAIGGAMVLALGMAIVTEAFPPSERGKALGLNGTIVSIGVVVGPTLGGLLLDVRTWHWIFFVNLPVGIVGTFLALRFIPTRRPSGHQRFDLLGATCLFFSLLALLLALTVGQSRGFADRTVLILFALWLTLFVAFVQIERRSSQPMVDLTLFRDRLFSINLATGLITFIALGGTLILMPFYLQNVLGYDTRQVGLLLAINPLAIGIAAPIAGALSDRFGTRPITAFGLLILFLGYYTMSKLNAQTTALGYTLRFLPVGMGMGIFQSPNNSAVMGAAPRARLGVASGLLSITRTLGQTAGIAVLGAFWASRVVLYEGALPPGGATAASASAQVAGLHDTFLVVMLLLAVGLLLSLWGLLQERQLRGTAALEANP